MRGNGPSFAVIIDREGAETYSPRLCWGIVFEAIGRRRAWFGFLCSGDEAEGGGGGGGARGVRILAGGLVTWYLLG